MNKVLKLAVAMVTAFAFGAIATYYPIKRHFKAELDTFTPKIVQVVKRDTVRLLKPIEIEKRIIDTIAIAVTDTLLKVDTLYLPREQKVYADSSYRAVISGVSPSLDSIEVYNKTIEITKIATRKEWRKFDYGVQIGAGMVNPVGEKASLGYYVGFGITYHF